MGSHLAERNVWFLVLLLLPLFFPAAQAQPIAKEFEIKSIVLDGNETFGSNELLLLLQTKTTPGFFNKFLYGSVSDRLGRKNEYLNPLTLGDDVLLLQQYYKEHGFQEVAEDTPLIIY